MYIQNMAFVYEIKIVITKIGLQFAVFYEDFVLLLFLVCAMAACNCMTKKLDVQDKSLQVWMFASVICV